MLVDPRLLTVVGSILAAAVMTKLTGDACIPGGTDPSLDKIPGRLIGFQVGTHPFDLLVNTLMAQLDAIRTRASLLLVVLCIVASCSQGPNTESAEDAQAVVVAGFDANEPELARFLRELVRAAKLAPDSAPRRGQLAMAYSANGFHKAAEATYGQAARLDPVDFRWPYYHAYALSKLSRLEDALLALDRAIAIDNEQVTAWLWRGKWLFDLDRHVEAADAYREAARNTSDRTSKAAANVGIARTLLRQERAEEAVVLLDSLAAQSAHPFVNQLRRRAYRQLGRMDEARRITAAGEAIAFAWPDALIERLSEQVRGFSGKLLIAQRLLQQKESSKSLQMLESLRQRAPHDRNLMNSLSIAYRLEDRLDEAFEVLKEGVRQHPDFNQMHFAIAVHYDERGEYGLALDHLNRSIELDPGFIIPYQRKYSILVRMERFAEALEVTEIVKRKDVASYDTMYSAGMVAGALERWPAAIEYFQQALSLDPAQHRAQLFLGRALAEAGRFDDAGTALDEAEQLGSSSQQIRAARARLARLEVTSESR